MTDKIQLKSFNDFLNESVVAAKPEPKIESAHYEAAQRSFKLGHIKEHHSSMAEHHAELEMHYDDLGNNKMSEAHGKAAHEHMMKAAAAKNKDHFDESVEAFNETMDSLFEDHLPDSSHISNAHAHLWAATNHLKNKDVDGFHNSMISYHTNMAKHHSQAFGDHLDKSTELSKSDPNEAKTHEDLAWAHSAAYDHHKQVAKQHSSYLKKKGRLLKEDVRLELESLAESLSPEAREDAGKQQASVAKKATDEASKLVDDQASASQNGGSDKSNLKEDIGIGAVDGSSAPFNSATENNVARKDMILGPMAKRKKNINEAKLNPATRPPAAPTQSKSNDSLPDKRKSLGKLKEDLDAVESDFLNESEQGEKNIADAKKHLDLSKKHLQKAEATDGAISFKTHMREHHRNLSIHHQIMSDHHMDKYDEAKKEGDHQSQEFHASKVDHHNEAGRKHVELFHDYQGTKLYEDGDFPDKTTMLDKTLVEDAYKSASYASVAAKHKFQVKGPSQTHVFTHSDHGTLNVNRENDTWEHNSAKPNTREKGKVTSGKGSEALDRHLRQNATAKQVHI